MVSFDGNQSLTTTADPGGQVNMSGGFGFLQVQGDGTLTVGAGITIHGMGSIGPGSGDTGDTLLNNGTIRGDSSAGALSLDLPVTNYGTLSAIGSGELGLYDANTQSVDQLLGGAGTAVSGTEVFLSSYGISGTTYSARVSTDGTNYSPVSLSALDALSSSNTTFVAEGLLPNTPYYLRVVATGANGTEIYDSGRVSTLDKPDASGWYSLEGIENLTVPGDGFTTINSLTHGNYGPTGWTFAGSAAGAAGGAPWTGGQRVGAHRQQQRRDVRLLLPPGDRLRRLLHIRRSLEPRRQRAAGGQLLHPQRRPAARPPEPRRRTSARTWPAAPPARPPANRPTRSCISTAPSITTPRTSSRTAWAAPSPKAGAGPTRASGPPGK